MAAIDYLTSKYGANAWTDAEIYWAGTADEFRLYVNGSPTPVYTGTGGVYVLDGTPSTRYDFVLEADVGAVTSSAVITVFTRDLPAPVNLHSTLVEDDAISLAWTAVARANSYDVADVSDSYAILASGMSTAVAFSALDPQTRHSYAVRAVMGQSISRWSAPLTLSTLAPAIVVPGVYEFGADSLHVWQAGRPGSTDPEWKSEASDWFHGDGFTWSDNAGVQETWMFYGSADFAALAGGTVTAFAMWVERASYGGDPGSVTNRFHAHAHVSKPVGEPTAYEQYEGVSLERGVGMWVPLPTSWANALIAGTRKGVSWGGCPERYMVATHTDVAASPRLGDLRITVS